MKFSTYPVADVSTSHITATDRQIIAEDEPPPRLQSYRTFVHQDKQGAIFSTALMTDPAERDIFVHDTGLSVHFANILAEAARQKILFVRFDRDGNEIKGAPTFPDFRYIFDDGWEHIFAGDDKRIVRFVFDAESRELVFLEIMRNHSWTTADRAEIDDVLDSLLNGNDIENQWQELGLTAATPLPDWAHVTHPVR